MLLQFVHILVVAADVVAEIDVGDAVVVAVVAVVAAAVAVVVVVAAAVAVVVVAAAAVVVVVAVVAAVAELDLLHQLHFSIQITTANSLSSSIQ